MHGSEETAAGGPAGSSKEWVISSLHRLPEDMEVLGTSINNSFIKDSF